MAKDAADEIQTADQFKTLLNTICQDLGRTLDPWRLFNKLNEARRGQFTKALSQSQSFWSVVESSLLSSVVFGLCRAYDDHLEALTLRTVIRTLQGKPAFLTGLPVITDQRLQADLETVDRRQSQTVKHLLIWRDNLYAHRNAQKIIDGTVFGDKFSITYDDVGALIDNGFRIVNGYSADIFGVSNRREMIGADDYLAVLRTLQADADAERRESERPAGL